MKTLLNFLTDLRKNNNRDWFNDNRKRYEEGKEQMLFFTELLIQEIHKFDESVPLIDPKDCLFRIFRDVRFSHDKSPYKTHMGSFIAPGGRKSRMAGYYIHVEPGNSFLGGGIWRPEAAELKAIRSEIYHHPEGFKEVIHDADFKNYYPSIEGEKLKTAPKGFPKDFEDIDLLRYKSYTFGLSLDDQTVLSDDFVGIAVDAFRELSKANRYLNYALGRWK
ncbi:DUF2461 domain-containing protein [uncultured Sunxiuqinia sp.]|uniref:DUF2461 domain-containing protein n=1 Tax=Sunxiuqinia rutila TaxID=1397841 RepID=UPI0026318B07|nr:DUF2461 domain-containing protein [uncultured Sunxiuqinia sp.]